ncbi:MAG: hypothetical protein FWC29_02750 [Methanomassiliicoccaceae archaeon]|nr:hypothetical protein [Methanomassiliicoccaceae archaeon]
MSNCKTTVEPGVCRLKTVIIANTDPDTYMVEFDIQSECPSVMKLAAALGPVSPYTEAEARLNNTTVYVLAGENLPHAACPVPCALMKTLEAAGGMALKRDVVIKLE